MRSSTIEHLMKRLRLLRFARMVMQLALLAAGVALLYRLETAISEKYLFDHPWIFPSLAGPVLIYLTVRTVARFRSCVSPKLAQELDGKHSLKDRLNTYVQLRDSEHPFLEPLIREAEAQLGRVSALNSAAFSEGTREPLAFALLPMLLLTVLPLLPVSPSLAGRIEQHRQLAQEARRLQTDARKMEQEAQKRPELKPLAAELNQLARDLQKPSLDPAEALKKLNAAQDHLKDIQDQSEKLQKDSLSREFDRLAKGGKQPGEMTESEKKQIRQMARELEQAMAEQKLDAGKEVRSAMENGRLSKEQMEQMKKSLDKFENEQAETEKRMAELQKSMDSAKKSASAGKNRVIFNSKIDDRQVETGKSGVDDGPGTTNKDTGPSKFDTHKQGKGEYMEDRTKAEYEQLYKGQREKAGSDPLFLNSQWDTENARFTRIRTFGVNSDTGTTGSSAGTVTQSEEESVIRKEKIPASYRNLVKKYFESIQK